MKNFSHLQQLRRRQHRKYGVQHGQQHRQRQQHIQWCQKRLHTQC